MKYRLLLLFFIAISTVSHGQHFQTDSLAQSEISKLYFLTGEWDGEGWILGEDRQKHSFRQKETVQFKLDSTIMLIEGLGKTQGVTTHNALAVISYNASAKRYDFRSYLASGREGTYPAEIIDEKFYWYPNENMRYIIYLNENDQWYETGEINHGGNWFQFFEMTLNKLDN